MQSTEPRIIEAVAEKFYELMRQIYVEQVWRRNGQSRESTRRSNEDGTTPPVCLSRNQ
jgi:hypothetical protein